MSSHIIHSSDTDFEKDVLKSTLPVLVDFWAEWCGPCRVVSPIVERIAEKYADKLSVVKIDVDKNAEASKKYNVRGIPTLIMFKEGSAVATQVGAVTESQLISFIDKNIA